MFELQYLVMRAQSKASKTRFWDDFPTVPMFFHGYEAKFPQREGGFTHQKGPLWDEIEHDWTSLSLWKMRGFHHVFSPCVFDPDMGLDILEPLVEEQSPGWTMYRLYDQNIERNTQNHGGFGKTKRRLWSTIMLCATWLVRGSCTALQKLLRTWYHPRKRDDCGTK